jgi:hypothetical protein
LSQNALRLSGGHFFSCVLDQTSAKHEAVVFEVFDQSKFSIVMTDMSMQKAVSYNQVSQKGDIKAHNYQDISGQI